MVVKKVAATVVVTKNSDVLTVPIVLRGSAPWMSRLEVTTGPQPPPPAASRNPPISPSGSMTRGLFSSTRPRHARNRR